MTKKFMSRLGFVFGAALILLACQPAEQEEESEATQTFGVAQVKAFKVRTQKISEKLVYTGVIEARKKIVINPDIGGKIADRLTHPR